MNIFEKIKNSENFFLICGPCLLESRELAFKVADFLSEYTLKNNITLIFKSSYWKANRTSLNSPTGPGIIKGLKILNQVKEKFGLPVLTDVHETSEISEVAEVADIIQIPAFLSRQTKLIVKAAETGKVINIKKGQFMVPEDMKAAAGKILSANNKKILITERGTTFGYHNLVVDYRNFSIMKEIGFPVVYDVTHSLQRPSSGAETGGTPQFAESLAKAALATGKVDGLFIETHPDPEKALSDSSTQLRLTELPELLDKCKQIFSITK